MPMPPTDNYDYTTAGFDVFMKRQSSTDLSEQLVADETSYQFRQISGTSIASGVSRSADGRIEIDWSSGVMTINFPIGYMKLGNLGTDKLGQEIQGVVLNDGTNDIAFWGFQPNGF